MRCPQCGSTHLAVQVETWANFYEGKPYFADGTPFDPEDGDDLEPKPGGTAICKECQNQFTVEP